MPMFPTCSTPGSACFDVYSTRKVTLGPGVTKSFELDLGMKIGKKYICRIYQSLSLSLKPFFIGVGVTDSDYRGNTSVILTNFSEWRTRR